ncbi:MAG: hypothetical protein V2B15_12635 [Bacteroidota bacterium]
MKQTLLISVALLGFLAAGLEGQDQGQWPAGSSSISFYAGTLGIVTPLSVQYEHLWHKKKVHTGISAGITNSFFCDGESGNAFLGAYLAMVFMTGMDEHHFEGRIGASYHPIYLFPDFGTKNEEIPFMPVITLGYRFQKPGGNRFYRVSIGTGGIGAGIGFVLKQPVHNEKE